MQLGDWGPLLGALESLIMRCAALESILESDEPMLYQTHLSETLGEPPVPLRNSAGEEAAMLWVQSHATADAAPTDPYGGSWFSARVLVCCQRPWLSCVGPTLLKSSTSPNAATRSLKGALHRAGLAIEGRSHYDRPSLEYNCADLSAKSPPWTG